MAMPMPYMLNSTSSLAPFAQDTYSGTFEQIDKYYVSLNYFEKLWLSWYTFMQNDTLATGLMSLAMHELVYFGRSLPWIIIDAIPWFRRYKIQQVCARLSKLHLPDHILFRGRQFGLTHS